MQTIVPIDNYGIFVDKQATVRVDSRYVAQFFEKRHDLVLRDIRSLDCSDEFRLLNFAESNYLNEQGHRQPCYTMTRDGFVFLVMGYRGKKAARFKEMYIKRFNDMEIFIKSLVSTRQQFPKLTEQIRLTIPDASPYHYSNECDMLNRIVLGMTAKQFRKKNGVEKGQSIRPYLSQDQISLLDDLQTVDIGLLLSVQDFQERKRILTNYAAKRGQRITETTKSLSSVSPP